MSITVNLYTNKSEKNRINKIITDELPFEGKLIQECSIKNPVLDIYTTKFGNKITFMNYMYIPVFGRYYFIDDIVSIRNNLWRVSASVDVLFSFKDYILDQEIVLERSTSAYDAYLNDNSVVIRSDRNVTQTKLTGGVGVFDMVSWILITGGSGTSSSG